MQRSRDSANVERQDEPRAAVTEIRPESLATAEHQSNSRTLSGRGGGGENLLDETPVLADIQRPRSGTFRRWRCRSRVGHWKQEAHVPFPAPGAPAATLSRKSLDRLDGPDGAC